MPFNMMNSHKRYPLTQVDAFEGELKKIVEQHGGVWSAEAEEYFLSNAPSITE